MIKALLLLLSLTFAAPVAAQDMPVATVVIFDAVCLTCHEGECSGRMALRIERGDEGLAGHVASYAGRQDDGTVSRLKTLMGRLKTECRLPPPPVAVPADGIWEPAALAPLTLADRQRVFLPLGRLQPGAHSVSFRLDEPQRLRLQVVADSFDIVLDEEDNIGPVDRRVRWRVDEPGEYFLRIIARRPMGALHIGP
ncbi:hypothetical protein H261_04323 [Paramagnetospirillum caucaseum]|uniref:Cytochrome c domain-containing protein n=1 Tax=Paramagnetospirillum caucaseum TaxID=1244869 RepID=M3AFB4_9PROT|nr:hypothetical protein [Paramagnetospirillum caucaseum]EME71264.1 hypothetical protein H261_04323 [Paramagnetospirillum caucaseum]